MKMFSGFTPSISAFCARRPELLALAEVGGEGHDLAAIGRLQPLQDDRGVEPAGIGEHDLLDVFLGHGDALKIGPDYRDLAPKIHPARTARSAEKMAEIARPITMQVTMGK